jgi:ankyrin repeat protein
LEYFDAENAPKNVVIAGLVEAIQALNRPQNQQAPAGQNQDHSWSASLNMVGDDIPMVELSLSIDRSLFVTKPSLFIAVNDRSGSMGGGPWRQVQAALKHIIGMTETTMGMVKTVIIAYESTAMVVPTTVEAVTALNAGGGTNFSAAFVQVKQVLKQYVYSEEQTAPNSISNVVVAFLTDGESGGDRDALVAQFREVIQESWNGPIAVHAVGFGANCDRVLLEGLRTPNGTFRYAEPGESDDALCHKLTSLFEVAAMSSVIPVTFSSVGDSYLFKKDGEYVPKLTVNFPINSDRQGEYKCWIKLQRPPNGNGPNQNGANPENGVNVVIDSGLDKGVVVPIRRSAGTRLDRWISVCIDELAVEVLRASESPRDKVFDLWCALIQQKIEALTSSSANNKSNCDRLAFLAQQTRDLRRGNAINVGKLSDLRFGSQFSQVGSQQQAAQLQAPRVASILPAQPVATIQNAPAFVERSVRYSHNGEHLNRNPLQNAIMSSNVFRMSSETEQEIAKIEQETKEKKEVGASSNALLEKDANGNTALHLASYCGQIDAVKRLVALCKDFTEDMLLNKDGETPVTLAIKRRGFHRTLGILLDSGYKVPPARVKALQRFALEGGYKITAEILSGLTEDTSVADESMTAEYVRFTFNRLVENKKEINLESFLRVSLSKCMVDLVPKLLEMGAEPTLTMFLEYCIPKKPDCPEVQTYLDLTKMVLAKKPEFVNMYDSMGEGALFKSADRGNLPCVQFFLDAGAEIDHPSELGNTPLWIACSRRYPCIVDELLNRGADPNKVNLKGNPPMYSICQKGPRKIAERLLGYGANVELINQNGDTMILLCCRNGQPDVLSLFLNYVDPAFVNRVAEIDGFNAIFASVEANRPECIKVLHEYGINVNEQYTARDNMILGGATPLHLAAYYGRVEAVNALLDCGANINAIDLVNGQTPLMVAVMQGNESIISRLRSAGADVTIQDLSGNTAASYSRDNSIRELLVNPALDILVEFAKGIFPKEQQQKACDVIEKYAGVVGCLAPQKALHMVGGDGASPLMHAVIHSNWAAVKLLTDLGVERNHRNNKGLSCAIYAHWINNPRIKALFSLSDSETERLAVIRRLPGAPKVLFLGPSPSQLKASNGEGQKNDFEQRSAIGAKMNDMFLDASNGVVAAEPSEQHIWNAKLQTFTTLASSAVLAPNTDAVHAFALALYCNNVSIFTQLNKAVAASDFTKSVIRERISLLCSALNALEPFVGECFLGSPYIDRKAFLVDAEVTFSSFVSASTLWRVATSNVPDFSSKKREGVVFIIKSTSGRFIANYSEFQYDCEVVFRPFARFKVTKWYHGDIIALGKFYFLFIV